MKFAKGLPRSSKFLLLGKNIAWGKTSGALMTITWGGLRDLPHYVERERIEQTSSLSQSDQARLLKV